MYMRVGRTATPLVVGLVERTYGRVLVEAEEPGVHTETLVVLTMIVRVLLVVLVLAALVEGLVLLVVMLWVIVRRGLAVVEHPVQLQGRR
jgi:hypothetical protein